MIAGASAALALSIAVTQNFKPDVLALPWLILWHAASLLIGGAAGLAGGLPAARLPIRAASAASWLSGAVFGALAFALQLYLFLLSTFHSSPNSF